jgi:hypothetical protein
MEIALALEIPHYSRSYFPYPWKRYINRKDVQEMLNKERDCFISNRQSPIAQPQSHHVFVAEVADVLHEMDPRNPLHHVPNPGHKHTPTAATPTSSPSIVVHGTGGAAFTALP